MSNMDGIGRVFTPFQWAVWLLEKSGAFEAWQQGAMVCDPTFGEGVFIESFLEIARLRGLKVSQEQLSRLFGVEIESSGKFALLERVHSRYGIRLPEQNFTVDDVLCSKITRKFDMLVGNPPWVNFSVLPNLYREKWAPLFVEFGLVKSKKNVLLGASRADLAALILKKTIEINLSETGKAAFFVPLSIFFNSGSNDMFRPFPGSHHCYAVETLWDFGDQTIFEGVNTRYGAALFLNGIDQKWPVKTFVSKDGNWVATFSTAYDLGSGFWRRHEEPVLERPKSPAIHLSIEQKPRQGVNTVGANKILIFTKSAEGLMNGFGELVDIESDLVFPLMDKRLFSQSKTLELSERKILLPHNKKTGKPLSKIELLKFPKATTYLHQYKDKLQVRKGTMLNAHLKRGLWWSLLGVGAYSFSPWKVAWEALGQKEFRPVVVRGEWQANQAMHAFCPCESQEGATRLAQALSSAHVENYLKSSAMAGTLNWAQPGRMSELFSYTEEQLDMLL